MGELPLFFVRSSVESAAPLALAAMGGVLSERSGVINFALEGMMLSGALAGALAGGWADGVVTGFVAAAAAGALLGFIHALAATKLRADQIVSSVAINLCAIGVTGLLNDRLGAVTCQAAPRLPWVGISPVVLLAAAVVGWTWFHLGVSARGLPLRAAGEDPQAAWLAGVDVTRVRITAVTVGGVFAGLAGASLTLGVTGEFRPNMSAGRGFIAIACIVCGGWRPARVAAVALLFGMLFKAADGLQQFAWISSHILPLVPAFPFILTVLVLGLKKGAKEIPRGLGKSVNNQGGCFVYENGA
jgi:simple sugar transport system permease protein